MPRGLNALPLLFLATSVFAETFYCTDVGGGAAIVVATINEDGRTGEVSVAGARHEAVYRVFGFDRTWAFVDEDEGTVYKFRIEPDGDGTSYEDDALEGKVSGRPQHFFKCQQRNDNGAKENGREGGADIRPIVKVNPVYPARALSRGISGYVDLSFTVTVDGTVIDPVVIQSTDSLFEGAAIQAVSKWRYKPQPFEVAGVQTRVEFVP